MHLYVCAHWSAPYILALPINASYDRAPHATTSDQIETIYFGPFPSRMYGRLLQIQSQPSARVEWIIQVKVSDKIRDRNRRQIICHPRMKCSQRCQLNKYGITVCSTWHQHLCRRATASPATTLAAPLTVAFRRLRNSMSAIGGYKLAFVVRDSHTVYARFCLLLRRQMIFWVCAMTKEERSKNNAKNKINTHV